MKKFIALIITLVCIIGLIGCDAKSGGEHFDRIPSVMVDGVLYMDTGKCNDEIHKCGTPDGNITSTVENWELPTENNQSNFGDGYGYQYGATNGTIEVYINEKWCIFATEEVRNDIQFPDEQNGQYQFDATILEIYDTYFLVEPNDGTQERKSSDKITVPTQNASQDVEWQVGDYVLITYNGEIMETYPAQLGQVYKIEKLTFEFTDTESTEDNSDSGPIETIDGNLKTYYKNTDGTWQVDGVTYKYRLEIKGRMPNAAVDSTFVYLSNIENITFEQAWKAAGLSSNLDDYFDVEEAVLVEMRTGTFLCGFFYAKIFQHGGQNLTL